MAVLLCYQCRSCTNIQEHAPYPITGQYSNCPECCTGSRIDSGRKWHHLLKSRTVLPWSFYICSAKCEKAVLCFNKTQIGNTEKYHKVPVIVLAYDWVHKERECFLQYWGSVVSRSSFLLKQTRASWQGKFKFSDTDQKLTDAPASKFSIVFFSWCTDLADLQSFMVFSKSLFQHF